MKSKQRHSGGAYRRMKTMKSMYVKPGKDRKKSSPVSRWQRRGHGALVMEHINRFSTVKMQS